MGLDPYELTPIKGEALEKAKRELEAYHEHVVAEAAIAAAQAKALRATRFSDIGGIEPAFDIEAFQANILSELAAIRISFGRQETSLSSMKEGHRDLTGAIRTMFGRGDK